MLYFSSIHLLLLFKSKINWNNYLIIVYSYIWKFLRIFLQNKKLKYFN